MSESEPRPRTPRRPKGISNVTSMLKTADALGQDENLPVEDRLAALKVGAALTQALAKLANTGKRRKVVRPKQEMSDILR
jgi:hypothetical protein